VLNYTSSIKACSYRATLRRNYPGPETTGNRSIAFRPGRLRHFTSDSSTASVNFGQRRNKDFSAHLPSMRAS
jgi:hypothetical protein